MGAMTRPEDQPESTESNDPAGAAARDSAYGEAPSSTDPHAEGDAHADADADADSTESPRKRSWKAVPTELWVWFAAALLFVAGVGFIVGDRMGPSVGGDVNLAGAPTGKNNDGPKPLDDGTYDAGVLGPRAGTAVTTPEDIPNMHRRSETDPFAMGAVDAPVVMTVFSDFECPFCARHALTTQRALIDDYVDAGLLRIEWNDMPVGGPRAERAAEAGRAAAAQGKFWEFQEAAFTKAQEKGNGHPEFTDEELIAIARDAGVPDMALFEKQLDEGTWKKAVEDATAYGRSLGVQATPQFLVGSHQVSGAQPEETFRDYIELELMKVKREQR